MSEEDAKRARELEAEIKELDTAITDQDAKVRNSLQHLRQSIENFIDSDSTLGNRVRALFRREGVTIASLLTAVGMTIVAVVEGIVLATRSAVSAVTQAPKPKPPGPKPPGPRVIHRLNHQSRQNLQSLKLGQIGSKISYKK